MDLRKFEFEGIVFFGRSIEEYINMFNLNLAELEDKKVLDCSAGPSAFAAQAHARRIEVTACDPRYEDAVSFLADLVETHANEVQNKQTAVPQLFHPELVSVSARKEAMRLFLDDFEQGKKSGRYVSGRLPNLPFGDQSFDLVLCANLLFIYSDVSVGGMMQSSPLDYSFHLESIKELVRVSRGEARLYPLLGPGQKRHKWLQPLIDELQNIGIHAEVVPVPQRDIVGAENMLVARRAAQQD